MSTPFPLEEAAQRETPSQGYYNPLAPHPQWYSGMGFSDDVGYLTPLVTGLGEGAAKGEQVMAGSWHLGAEGLASLAEAVNAPGAKELRSLEEDTAAFKRDADARVAALTPNAATTGQAAQTIHSLVSGAYRVALGSAAGPAGGALLLGSTEATSRYQQLRDQGVDPRTAVAAAMIDGTAAGAGAFVPMGYGTTLLARLATGAAANTGFGLVNRYADHKVLEAAGYKDMADQQRVMDGTQLLTDSLLGAAFGGISHVHANMGARARDVPGVEDAALTENLALRDRSLAPGVPATPAAAEAHDLALRTATSQLLQEEPVDVSQAGVDRQAYVPRPAPDLAEPQAMLLHALGETNVLDEERNLAALEESLNARLRGEKPTAPASAEPVIGAPSQEGVQPVEAGVIPRGANLTPEQAQIEGRFADQIQRDLPTAKAAYAQLEETDGGRILNTDMARELSPDYLADRTQSAPVHEPASWLIKQLYSDALKEPADADHDNTVLFTGGGTGAGKSTAIKQALAAQAERAQIVFDTNLSNTRSAAAKIDQALAAGKDVQIAYVHREPSEALSAGALKRAMRQEAEFGSGRTVPIEAHVETHVGANRTIRELAERYAGNPKVSFRLIDNTRGKGNARLISVEDLPRLDYNLTREQVSKTLESEFAAGRISAAVYRGFRGAGEHPVGEQLAPASTPPAAGSAEPAEPAPGLGPEAGRQPEPQRARGRPDELAEHTVVTATGRRVEVRPKVVEASDLVTSDRPEYPAELQPRQRGKRAALSEQVNSIARNLNPEMLGNAPEADRGAPIVGPDNVVESGNGRVFALRQAYREEGADAYRAWLKDQGHDVEGVKEPVLVRERVTPMTAAERRDFTVEANQTSVAGLSPVERAQADARLLEPGVLAQLRNGDIAQVQNAPFVRAFLTRLPEGERNALVNPDGSVSQEGVRRLQAAILAKAYGGAPESNAVLGRMLESTDNDMRSTMGALLDAAPAFARLRQAIEEGKVGPEYDLSRALTRAVETTTRVREGGQALGEFLKQEDFLTRREPAVDALMRALYEKNGERLAPRERVAQRLMNYADRALKERLDQGMLFGDGLRAPEELLAAPEREAPQEMRESTDMFGLRTPQGKVPGGAGPEAIARGVLERQPNLEVVGDDGEATRGRAEFIGSAEDTQTEEGRAPGALESIAKCTGQRAA